MIENLNSVQNICYYFTCISVNLKYTITKLQFLFFSSIEFIVSKRAVLVYVYKSSECSPVHSSSSSSTNCHSDSSLLPLTIYSILLESFFWFHFLGENPAAMQHSGATSCHAIPSWSIGPLWQMLTTSSSVLVMLSMLLLVHAGNRCFLDCCPSSTTNDVSRRRSVLRWPVMMRNSMNAVGWENT